jgi:outer membrane protein assembly factor BamB
MNRSISLAAVCLLLGAAASASAADAIKHRILFVEYGKGPNRLVELDPDGKLVWEYKFPGIAVIFQPLPDGHVVFAHGGDTTGVDEIDRDKKTVWTYVSKCPQVLGCQRLDNGNTLLGEQGPPRAVEVNPKGEIVHVTKMSTTAEGYHLQVRNLHKLANGNILAAHEGEGAVREYDPDGKVVWEYTKVDNTGEALRLDNGNTLISCGTQKRVIEVTPAGEIVWEFGAKDAPELNLTWAGSLQILKNGHYIVGNFLRGQEGKGAHAFEVTKDKKVVWTFADHALVKSIATIRVLDDK